MNIKKVEELIKESLLGKYEVLNVEYMRENNHNYLRVTIDTIILDECTAVSKIISPIIDKSNLINDKYFLEVGSKGEEKQ